jgi:hypothetical protein
VVNEVVREYLTNYRRDEASVVDALMGQGGNCQVRAHFLTAVVNQIPGLVPPGYELGIQTFSDHVQAVLVPSDSQRHEVIDLLTNTEVPRRLAPIYRPGIAIRGALMDAHRSVRVSERDLLLRASDEERNRMAEAQVAIRNPSVIAHNQSWASGAMGVYSEGEVPETLTTPLPGLGPPRRVSAPLGLGMVSSARRPKNSSSESRNVAEDLSPWTRIADQLQDSRVRQGLEGFCADTGRDVPLDVVGVCGSGRFANYLEAHPDITAEEIVEILPRMDWESGNTALLDSWEYRRNVAFLASHYFGVNDLNSAVVSEAEREARRIVEEMRARPETMIENEEAPGISELIDEYGYVVGSNPRRRMAREEIQAFNENRAQNPRLDTLIRYRVSRAQLRAARIYDDMPEAALLDWVANPENLGPEVNLDTAAEILEEESAAGSSSSVNTASVSPASVAGRSGSGGGVQAGAGASGAVRSQSRPSDLLRAQNTLSADRFRGLALLYLEYREGHMEEKRALLSRWVQTYVRVEEGGSARNGYRRVCGRYDVPQYSFNQLRRIARDANIPSFPCPHGGPEFQF